MIDSLISARVAWRIVRRSRTGIGRVIIAALGVAFAAGVGLLVLTILVATENGQQRADARTPRFAAPGEQPTLIGRGVQLSLDGRPVTQVMLAASSPDAPVPPGISRVPRAGESFISPALAVAISQRRGPSSIVDEITGGYVSGTISDPGLRDPDEFFAYVGVDASRLEDDSIGIGGFGGRADQPISVLAVLVELLILVGPPIVMFTLVASRLSSATRERRWASLRLAGMQRKMIAGVARWEGAAIGVLGTAAAVVVHRLVAGTLGARGTFGLFWFRADSRLSLPVAVAFIIGTGLLTGRLAAASVARRPDTAPRARRPSHEVAPWRVLPFVVGLGLLTSISVLRMSGHLIAGRTVFLVVGVLLALGGMPLILSPLVSASARRLGDRSPRVSVRLGARRAQYEPGSILRVLVGVSLLVALGGLGAGVLHDLELGAGANVRSAILTIDTATVSPSARRAVSELPAEARFLVVPSDPTGDPPRWYPVVVAPCAGLVRFVDTHGCQENAVYRLVSKNFPPDLQPGMNLSLPTTSGPRALIVPASTLTTLTDDALPIDALVVTSRQIDDEMPSTGSIVLQVPTDVIDGTTAQIVALAPGAQISDSRDLRQIETYHLHDRILRTALLAAVLISAAALAITTVDRQWERRRNVAALVAVGARRRVIQWSQVVQMILPTLICVSIATVVGDLTAQSYLQIGGLSRGWYFEGLLVSLRMAAVGSVVALGAALVVPIPKQLPRYLRSE